MRHPPLTQPHVRILAAILAMGVLLRLAGCSDAPAPTEDDASDAVGAREDAAPAPSTAETYVLVGAADIAHCGKNLGDERTAEVIKDVIASEPNTTVFAAGDVVYERGTAAEFANCYEPSWGQFKSRTRPALGNHDYDGSDATPYHDYFGALAGEPGNGYYSYDLGQWHIIVLNSMNAFVPTGVGSPQNQWLKADLAATAKPCVLAYWHHARFRSSITLPMRPPESFVKPFWDALYAARADVVLVGHQHFYERFAPQTPDGMLDTENGIRQFTVGMGGKSTGDTPTLVAPNSEVRHGGPLEFGVLKLTLGPSGYTWQYLPVAGKTFTDSGSGTCHPKNPGGGSTDPTLAINEGNNQRATVGTAVARPLSAKVTAGGSPVPGVAVTFAVAAGGGSITGASQTTDASGIATLGSWTLGTQTVPQRLTATAPGVAGSPVTFSAIATAGAPVRIAIYAGNNQTAPAGTAVARRPAVKVMDSYGNGVPNVTVTFAIASGGGSLTKASIATGGGGIATVGSWILGPTPGPNSLTATASGTGIADNPVTFTATGT